MTHPFHFSITLLTAACLAGTAFAAPPQQETDVEILTEKLEDRLSEHKIEIAKSTARLKRKLDKGRSKTDGGDISEDIEVVMDVLEDAFSEKGLFRSLASMMGDFAEDIDVETKDGDTALIFDGIKVAQIQREKTRNSNDRFSISGLGKNLTIDKEKIVKNGKSKTRIVIDMDGEDEIDITLPKLD